MTPTSPRVFFDSVWKKFRLGERHDSLRDLIPTAAKRLLGREDASVLDAQEFWALRDISFQVPEGEALGIIGHNGAGKSTALKLLTRILKPTKGHTEVRGRVGALIEVAAGFHPDLTGRENVFLQGAIMGMKQAEIARRFDDIVAFSGVERFIDTQLKRYSSGMNARLGFAVAAHLEPEVLIIDEVLSVGDSMFQARCLDRIMTLKQAGVTLVFVSHNLPAVESLCDRVLWLQKGEAKFLGAPRSAINLYLESTEQPRTHIAGGYRAEVQDGIKFEHIEFLDVNGVPTSHIVSGTGGSLRFSVVGHGPERDAIIGFSLTTVDRHTVFGENSTVEYGPLRLGGGKRVKGSVTYESLPLPEGRYYFVLEVHSPATNEMFDRVENAVSIDVDVPRAANRIGSILLKSQWWLDTMTQPVIAVVEKPA